MNIRVYHDHLSSDLIALLLAKFPLQPRAGVSPSDPNRLAVEDQIRTELEYVMSATDGPLGTRSSTTLPTHIFLDTMFTAPYIAGSKQ
jgi:hypothetical protein